MLGTLAHRTFPRIRCSRPSTGRSCIGSLVLALTLSSIAIGQVHVVQSENLGCGGAATFQETIRVSPLPHLGIDASAVVPPGQFGFLFFDVAVVCRAFAAPPTTPIVNPRTPLRGGILAGSPVPIPPGRFSVRSGFPALPALLNHPFAAQFVRYTHRWETGPSFDIVLAGMPVPRGRAVPAAAEKELFAEHHLRWSGFGIGSPRYARMQQFVSRPGLVIVAPGTPGGVSEPFGSAALHRKIGVLVNLVQQRWGHLGYQLRLTSAKRPPGGSDSYHQNGRAVDLSLATASGAKLQHPSGQARHLDRLTRLAVEAGFGRSFHEPTVNIADDHLHASVHTGGPVITNLSIGPAVRDPSTNDLRWLVRMDVADPDGVWQVFAHVTPLGSPVPWSQGAAAPFHTPRQDLESTLPTVTTVTFDVMAPASVLRPHQQAVLHVWARDTFGSVDVDPAQTVPRLPRTTTLGVTLSEMVPIPAGSFSMGSNAATGPPHHSWIVERPVHQVTITRPFWIGRYEVTQAEWEALMGTKPSTFQGANRPVEALSGNDAMAYCAALTAREAAAGRVPAGYQYRLPTEAEWEYCCRAGTTTEFHFGNSLSCGQVNFRFSTYTNRYCDFSDTFAVGSFIANAWGLHDMHGNVWEWCLDSWDGSANYPSTAAFDPYVPSAPFRIFRIFRGGSWYSSTRHCRSAYRYGDLPNQAGFGVGFRVVLAPILVP